MPLRQRRQRNLQIQHCPCVGLRLVRHDFLVLNFTLCGRMANVFRSATGFSGIIVFFFTIHCNPSIACIALRITFKARNAMRVYSYSYLLVIFFVQPIAADWLRGRGGKLWRVLGKTIYLMNTLQFMGVQRKERRRSFVPPPFWDILFSQQEFILTNFRPPSSFAPPLLSFSVRLNYLDHSTTIFVIIIAL